MQFIPSDCAQLVLLPLISNLLTALLKRGGVVDVKDDNIALNRNKQC